MASGSAWPQSLKDFANRTFAACNDSNRQAVSEELKQIIFEKFSAGLINETDWNNVVLKSLASGNKKKKRAIGSTSLSTPADEEARQKRARRFEQEQSQFQRRFEEHGAPPQSAMSLAGRLSGNVPNGIGKAAPSWGTSYVGSSTMVFDTDLSDPNVIDWDEHTVVGTSTKLEKSYLRLTSAPDPRTVRSLATLRLTLDHLKEKWRNEENYAYTCDQFKSLRQDLTVQRIKNDFTVQVYEVHARIALQASDLGEFNQCASQLRTLYAYGLPGNPIEFMAYRILYLLHTRNRRDVNGLMAELTPFQKQQPPVAHALGVRTAIVTGNYHSFFQLYANAPNMNGWIMDHFVERERVSALLIWSKSHRPSIPLRFMVTELCFDDAAAADQFLESLSAAIYIEPTPAEAASRPPTLQTFKKGKPFKQQLPLEQRNWDAKAANAPLTTASAKFKKVDIKGQV